MCIFHERLIVEVTMVRIMLFIFKTLLFAYCLSFMTVTTAQESLTSEQVSPKNNDVHLSKVESPSENEETAMSKFEVSSENREASLPKVETSPENGETVTAKFEASSENGEASLPKVETFHENMDVPFSETSEFDEDKDFSLFWKAVFEAKVFSASHASQVMMGTEIYGKVKWRIMDRFYIYNEALFVGRTGFTGSIYDRADRGSNVYPVESYFNWGPLSFLTLRLGLIKQDFLKAPLLITDKTFSGVIQKVSFFDWPDKATLSLFLQQAIVNSPKEFAKQESEIVKFAPMFLQPLYFWMLKIYYLLKWRRNSQPFNFRIYLQLLL